VCAGGRWSSATPGRRSGGRPYIEKGKGRQSVYSHARCTPMTELECLVARRGFILRAAASHCSGRGVAPERQRALYKELFGSGSAARLTSYDRLHVPA
jgi:hypothetical protein